MVNYWFHMETNRIRQFRAIVESGGFRQAADIIGISHSGLSKSMAALEQELGFELIESQGRGVVLSDRGKIFLSKTTSFLAALEDLTSIETSNQTFRIGTFEVFSTWFMGAALASEKAIRDLDIRELIPGSMETALVNNEIDVGITYEPVPTAGVEFLRLGTIEMGVFGRKDLFKSVTQHTPFAAPLQESYKTPTGVQGLDGWPDHKVSRNVRYRVTLMETAMSLCRQGLCCIFIPRFVARLHNKFVVPSARLDRLKEPAGLGQVKRRVFVAKRPGTKEDSNIKMLSRSIRQICT